MNIDLSTLDWIVVIVFFVLTLAIGLALRKKASGSLADFFLGGRKLPWWIAGTSMVATTFAADTPLAVTELTVSNGIAGNWIWWNALLGGMLTVFFFAALWRRSGVLTDAELVELRYSGKPAAFLRGFKAIYLGLFMNILIIGWVNVALRTILTVFFDISENQAMLFVAAAMVTAVIYSSLSGLLGVAVTDFIQFFVAVTGCIILAVLVLNSEEVGGITGLKEKLPEGSLNFFPEIGGGESPGSTIKALTLGLGSFLAFAAVQWWASWYPGAEPGGGGYIAQRMMSAKNEKHAVAATLLFQIAHYCLRPWPWIITALCAAVLYPTLAPEDAKIGYVLTMKEFLPPGLKGLLLAAFFGAYMSTISTQLNWGASYLVNDLYKRFIKPTSTERKSVAMSRWATVLLMVIGLAVSFRMNSIAAIWMFIIECGAGLGLVLILRWYWWRINAASEIIATIAPFVAYAVSKFILKIEFPTSFFITVGFTTLAWVVGTFLTKPTDSEHLNAFYKRVLPGGNWKPVRERLNLPRSKSKIGLLLVCWLSAVMMAYAVLFGTGKFLFKEYTSAGLWLAVTLVSGITLIICASKADIFGKKN